MLSGDGAADPSRVAHAGCNLAIQGHGILEDAQRLVLCRSMQQSLLDNSTVSASGAPTA